MSHPLDGSLVFKASGPDAAVPGRLLLENLGTADTLVGRDGDKCLCAVNVTIAQIEALAHINVSVEEGLVTLGIQALNFPVDGFIRFQEAQDNDSQITDALLTNFIEFASMPDNSLGRWRIGKRGADHATEPSWLVIFSSGLPTFSDTFDVLKISPEGKLYLQDDINIARSPTGLDTFIGINLTAQNESADATIALDNVIFKINASDVDYGTLMHQGVETLWWTQTKLQAFVPVELPGNPTEDLHAIPKQYVDKWAVNTVTDDYEVVPGEDHVILIDAATKTVTLPDAVTSEGQHYKIKLIASATTGTVDTNGGDIDGSASYSLSAQWKYVEVVSDGTDWMIVANN